MEQKADQQRNKGANSKRGLAFVDEVYYHICPPLPEECWSLVADADQLVIYSLKEQPLGMPPLGSPPRGIPRLSDRQGDIETPSLHGYPILGQVDIVDSETIYKAYSSLRAGAEEGALGIKCFIPHHGIRAICGQATLDLVICFLCTNMQVFDSSRSQPFMADMSRKPQALLEKLLRARKGKRKRLNRSGSSVKL